MTGPQASRREAPPLCCANSGPRIMTKSGRAPWIRMSGLRRMQAFKHRLVACISSSRRSWFRAKESNDFQCSRRKRTWKEEIFQSPQEQLEVVYRYSRRNIECFVNWCRDALHFADKQSQAQLTNSSLVKFVIVNKGRNCCYWTSKRRVSWRVYYSPSRCRSLLNMLLKCQPLQIFLWSHRSVQYLTDM